MDKKLIIPVQLFALSNPILLSEENSNKMIDKGSLTELPSKITDLAKSYKIKKIILYGDENYLIPIKESILTYALSQYNNNELDVVIEKGE